MGRSSRSSGDPIELPDEGELVIAIIKKIMPYGAFCTLTEYGNVEGFLHISEVAPRWIKNIHEFISEGQRHVVLVHRVDRQKGQVDISIKRVSDEQRKRKLEQVRNEKRGAKMLELSIEAAKVKIDAAKAREAIEEHYPDVFSAFREASLSGEDALKDIDLPKALKSKIFELAVKSIKKPVVEVDAVIELVCYSQDGVEDLKKALKVEEGISVHYLGAPKYKISLSAPDYKSGEKRLSKVLEHIKDFAQKNNCDFRHESR